GRSSRPAVIRRWLSPRWSASATPATCSLRLTRRRRSRQSRLCADSAISDTSRATIAKPSANARRRHWRRARGGPELAKVRRAHLLAMYASFGGASDPLTQTFAKVAARKRCECQNRTLDCRTDFCSRVVEPKKGWIDAKRLGRRTHFGPKLPDDMREPRGRRWFGTN